MRIIKIGSFGKGGCPENWHIDPKGMPEGVCKKDSVVYLDPNGSVFVRGVEIVEWSDERKKAMGRYK